MHSRGLPIHLLYYCVSSPLWMSLMGVIDDWQVVDHDPVCGCAFKPSSMREPLTLPASNGKDRGRSPKSPFSFAG